MIIRKWIGRVTTGILAIAFIATAWFAVSAKVAGGTPNIMGYQLMTVLSGSMEPSIHTGSVIAIKPVDNPTAFKVGDVVTYRMLDDPNKMITHRVKEVQKETGAVRYITKGDNNASEDPKPIPAGSIVGKYADFTIPYVGYVLGFAKSQTGLIWLMIVPGALLIVWQMASLFISISRLEKEKNAAKASVNPETPHNV